MNLIQQKEARQVESFNYADQSPDRARLNTALSPGEQDLKNVQTSRASQLSDPRGRQLTPNVATII